MPEQYDNTNKGSAWKVWGCTVKINIKGHDYHGCLHQITSDNPKAPAAQLYLVAPDGTCVRVGLWKTAPERKDILSGNMDFSDGSGVWINVYKNDRKKGPKSPDLNFLIQPKAPAQHEGTQQDPQEQDDEPPTGDDIPFS